MALIAKENRSKGDFEHVPAGTHIGVCYGVIDLGTQNDEKPDKALHRVMLIWELPQEKVNRGGKEYPMTITKEYTVSLGELATLRKHLQAWRNREFTPEELAGFDISKVLGKSCMLGVVEKTSAKGNKYTAVETVSSLPKGTTPYEPENALVHYQVEQGKNETYQNLPEYIRKKIAACIEWTSSQATQALPTRMQEPPQADDGDESVPF